MTNKLSILMYHSLDTSGSVLSVDPTSFKEQMSCLADEGLRGISLREAVAHHDANGTWPEKSVALTFDDGFANFHDVGLPVLEQHNFSATMFLVSGYMGKHNDWSKPPAKLGRRPILTWSQAGAIAAAGIEIGSHTVTHPDLRSCTKEGIAQELNASKTEIEERLGLKVECFAYPYGGVNQLSRQLASSKYHASCTTELRRANGDALEVLPRLDMHYFKSPARFRRLLNGELGSYLLVRRWGRFARRIVVSDS